MFAVQRNFRKNRPSLSYRASKSRFLPIFTVNFAVFAPQPRWRRPTSFQGPFPWLEGKSPGNEVGPRWQWNHLSSPLTHADKKSRRWKKKLRMKNKSRGWKKRVADEKESRGWKKQSRFEKRKSRMKKKSTSLPGHLSNVSIQVLQSIRKYDLCISLCCESIRDGTNRTGPTVQISVLRVAWKIEI